MFCLPYPLKSKGKCLEGKEVSLSYFCRRIKWHLRKCLPDLLIILLAWIRGSAEHPSEAERTARESSVLPDVPVFPVPSDSPRFNNCSVQLRALAHGPQDGRPFPTTLRSQALPKAHRGITTRRRRIPAGHVGNSFTARVADNRNRLSRRQDAFPRENLQSPSFRASLDKAPGKLI